MDHRENLIQAACSLLSHKSFDRITVQDIITAAGCSRATFYRCFRDKYDLMQTVYSSRVGDILSRFNGSNMESLACEAFVFLQEQQRYFKNVSRYQGANSFWELLYTFTADHYQKNYLKNTGTHELSTEERYRLHHAVSGTVGLMQRWMEEGMKLPPAEIAHLVYTLCPPVYCTYERKQNVRRS